MNPVYFLFHGLFPPKCILCNRLLEDEETDLCGQCRTEAPEYSEGKLKLQFLDSFTAIWYYEGSIRASLHRYKFCNARHLAPAYGRLLAMKVQKNLSDGFDVITWVPISPWRKFLRGYDQDELLAQMLAKELGTEPVRLLRKIRHNPPQSNIRDYAERKANVLNCYRAENEDLIRGKRVLLVDDILTSGATAGECARMLRRAGAKEVHCAVVAAANKNPK